MLSTAECALPKGAVLTGGEVGPGGLRPVDAPVSGLLDRCGECGWRAAGKSNGRQSRRMTASWVYE